MKKRETTKTKSQKKKSDREAYYRMLRERSASDIAKARSMMSIPDKSDEKQ